MSIKKVIRLPRYYRECIRSHASRAAYSRRVHHKDKLIDFLFRERARQLLEIEVLNDVNPAIRDQNSMTRKDRALLRNDLEAKLVVAGEKDLLGRKPSRGRLTRSRTKAREFCAVRFEILPVARPNQQRVARLYVDALRLRGCLEIFRGYFFTGAERFDILEA